MFVVRRRSDGMFGTGARANDSYGKEKWTDDLNKVLPYRSINALKNAMGYGWQGWYMFGPNKHVFEADCCRLVEQGFRGRKTKKCTHWKRDEAAHKREWEANYEILTVGLQITGKAE